MMTPWHESLQQLKFQLSYLTVGEKYFRLEACEVGISGHSDEFRKLPPDRELPEGFDGFLIRGLPVDDVRPTVERRGEFIVYTPWHFERSYIDFDIGYDAYLATFKAKTRSTIRRKVRKFSSAGNGNPDFKTYRTPEEVQRFLRIAKQISQVTYQERLLDEGLPKDPSFADKLIRESETTGVRGFILFEQGRPVSYLLLLSSGDTLVYSYLGYDPAYRKLSPGIVLHWLAIERLFDDHDYRILDFTEGGGQQKEQFRTGSVQCATIYCLRKSFRNTLLIDLHRSISAVSRVTGRALEAIGIKNRLKKLMRGFGK